MRWIGISLLLLSCGTVAAFRDAPRENAPAHAGLEVHEWGVWRVHNDVDLANQDMLEVWESLPPFVYGAITGRDLPKHWHNVETVDKPVLFFHTPDVLEVDLRIDFPNGRPGVWWPGTERPGIIEGQRLPHPDDGVPRSLSWRLRLKDSPVERKGPVSYAPVPVDHWVSKLRQVKANDVYAHVGERRAGCERERFVYYDGLLPRGNWATIAVEKDRVLVGNRAKHPLYDLTVVDGRTPSRPRVARLAQLDAQAAPVALTFANAPAPDWPKSALRTLTDQLHAAGLNEDEAAALVELWKKDLFLTEGVTLFYRIPQAEYDRQLPLTMDPRPEKLVRVGLAVHPHCEPDLAAKVAALVKDLDNDNFAVREDAQKRLSALGRAAFVHLVRMQRQTTDPEARQRIERLLSRYDGSQALPR